MSRSTTDLQHLALILLTPKTDIRTLFVENVLALYRVGTVSCPVIDTLLCLVSQSRLRLNLCPVTRFLNYALLWVNSSVTKHTVHLAVLSLLANLSYKRIFTVDSTPSQWFRYG